ARGGAPPRGSEDGSGNDSLTRRRRVSDLMLRPSLTRREFLLRSGCGFGGVALAALLSPRSTMAASGGKGSTIGPHFPPRARNVIHLFMHGGPSHVDLFDYKPELIRHAGKPIPESVGPVMTRRKEATNPPHPPRKPSRRAGASLTQR